MNKDFFTNLIIFIGVCILIYFVFRSINFQEGIENNKSSTSSSSSTTTSSSNGVAGGASSYAANVKTEAIKLQDELLVSKYRTDYENLIIALDDFCDVITLKCLLNVKFSEPNAEFQMMMAMQQLNLMLLIQTLFFLN